MTRCSPLLSLWWTSLPRTLDIWYYTQNYPPTHTQTHSPTQTHTPTYQPPNKPTHQLNIFFLHHQYFHWHNCFKTTFKGCITQPLLVSILFKAFQEITFVWIHMPQQLSSYSPSWDQSWVKCDVLRWTSVPLRTVWTAMLVNVALVSSPSRVISLFERNSMRINVSASKYLPFQRNLHFHFGPASVVLSLWFGSPSWPTRKLWEKNCGKLLVNCRGTAISVL